MSIYENIKRMKLEQREQLRDEDKLYEDSIGIQSGVSTVYNQDIGYYGKISNYLKQAKGWIYACVNVIADEIAGTQVRLKKFENDDVEEIFDHPVLDLLYRANTVTTKFDLIKLTFQFLELTGEAPWFLSFKGGKPVNIILLRPERLSIIPGKDGEMVGGYKYIVYGVKGREEIELDPFEVVPIRYTDPDLPLRGKGPLQAIQETVMADDYAEGWNKSFFKNSASPSSVLESDKVLAKEVRARLETKLRQNYEGYNNAHKTMILEAGLKFKPLSISQKDMDFIEQQRFNRDKILAIFRVPRTVLGITDDVNRANAEATDYVFAKRTVKPKLHGFEEQLNEFLVPLFDKTGKLYLEFDDPVPENVELKIKIADGVQKGYMTVNEARELFNLDAIEGGDELRDPVQFNPIANSAGLKLEGKKKKHEIGAHIKHRQSRIMRPIKQLEDMKKVIADTLQEKITPVIYEALKQKKKEEKKIKLFEGTPEESKKKKLEFQAIQLRIGAEFEKKFISFLSGVFENQKDDIFRKLDDGSRVIVLEMQEQITRYKKMEPILLNVIEQQSREAFQLLGQDNELTKIATRNEQVASYLRTHPVRLARELTETTNALLEKALSAGVLLEEGVPKLKKRVAELFEDMESYRSERIARTEVSRATSFATHQAYVESGVVEKREWLTNFDERTDDECADMDGEVAALGQSFRGGVEDPPLHVNCRCNLIPVIEV